MSKQNLVVALAFCFSISAISLQAQTTRASTTGVPFAAFTPDARSAAMGDAGVALSPDANSVYWGAAKLANSTKNYGVAFSYTPWLRSITDDMYFFYGSGYKKIGKNQAFGASLMYFDHGKFESRNAQGQNTGDFYANEFYGSIAYGRKLSDKFSVGLNLKYINSNLTGNYVGQGQSLKAASSVGGDISAFYNTSNIDPASGKGWDWAVGAMIQNIGSKINYGGATTSNIPTTAKVGVAATRQIDAYNKITLTADVNKLLVGMPDSTTFSTYIKGSTASVGVEYWYNNLFAARGGYFYENSNYGNRKYFTIGFGARIQQRYGLDFAYLMPQGQGSPLANTFRISLVIDMFKKTDDTEEAN